MQDKGKGPDASDQPAESGLPDIKQLAWARLLTMLCQTAGVGAAADHAVR